MSSRDYEGFAPYAHAGVILAIGQTARLNVVMHPAGVIESVAVTHAAAARLAADIGDHDDRHGAYRGIAGEQVNMYTVCSCRRCDRLAGRSMQGLAVSSSFPLTSNSERRIRMRVSPIDMCSR